MQALLRINTTDPAATMPAFVGINAMGPTLGIVWWNQQDAAAAWGGIGHWAG